jgi:hypothetical protein
MTHADHAMRAADQQTAPADQQTASADDEMTRAEPDAAQTDAPATHVDPWVARDAQTARDAHTGEADAQMAYPGPQPVPADSRAAADADPRQDAGGPWPARDDLRPAHASQEGMSGSPERAEARTQLLAADELADVVTRWREIQAQFVDEPRKAVTDADALVSELMERLTRMFAGEREQLESRWSTGNDVSTEDLRRGLQRYRSFFERLLAA